MPLIKPPKSPKDDDRCGLEDWAVTPRWDAYRKRACRPHDVQFQARLDGKEHDNLAQVSVRWAKDTTITAAIAAVTLATFPLYLVGGLLGGALRWWSTGPNRDK